MTATYSRRFVCAGGAAALAAPIAALADGERTVRLQLFMTQSALPKPRRGLANMHARLFSLSGTEDFIGRSFSDLYRDWYEPMKTPVLARVQVDFNFRRPKTVELPAPPGTKFLGVIAPYRSLQGKTWLAIAPYDEKRRGPVEIDIDKKRVRFR